MQAKAALSEVKHMPMLVPPAPWRTPYSGGHVLTPACIMRGHDSHYKDAVLPVEQATYQRMPEVSTLLTIGQRYRNTVPQRTRTAGCRHCEVVGSSSIAPTLSCCRV